MNFWKFGFVAIWAFSIGKRPVVARRPVLSEVYLKTKKCYEIINTFFELTSDVNWKNITSNISLHCVFTEIMGLQGGPAEQIAHISDYFDYFSNFVRGRSRNENMLRRCRCVIHLDRLCELTEYANKRVFGKFFCGYKFGSNLDPTSKIHRGIIHFRAAYLHVIISFSITVLCT